MSSIRLRLFATLALVTALVWGGAVFWVEIQTRAEVQRVLDRRLMESARMVSSLMQAGSVRPAIQAPDTGAADVYDRQLSCQIWSLEGDLIGRSQSAPAERLSEGADGFSERTIRGERWRVYTVHDRDAGFRVMVGDNLAVREHLVGNVVTALIGPAVLGLLALGVLIWWSVGRGLAPIRQMTRSLAVRDAEDLTALDVSPDARELRPFALALNDLMSRLGAARRREAEFTAAAAHELRTPLAGLRVQAQIAASSSDPAVRSRALEQIQTSVDRTARLVTGLLALAREDDMPVGLEDRRWVSLRSLFAGAEGDGRVTFVEGDALLHVDPDRFSAAAANLLANAQAHAASSILISYDPTSGRLIVEDDGPGVAFSDLHRLGRRFFRASNAPSGGSGLGLSIVLATVKAHGGQVQFLRSAGGGLRIEVTIPEQAQGPMHNSGKPVD
ncbi:ATP-binding protein [Brevundimonas fontaquae]|uniref:histidine kinase n=1 Tax=Brevundimonas fontaquae TaxID=2813778 RepID=A0ABX7LTX3_9CAUL|nr:ATP-binding protein [Brevundimonas fontaquae]QSF55185.1 sensor histidine kinase N-terminal domain-containing protein [Brevundimonas fontaquae]